MDLTQYASKLPCASFGVCGMSVALQLRRCEAFVHGLAEILAMILAIFKKTSKSWLKFLPGRAQMLPNAIIEELQTCHIHQKKRKEIC
jgi:hypothetical protein